MSLHQESVARKAVKKLRSELRARRRFARPAAAEPSVNQSSDGEPSTFATGKSQRVVSVSSTDERENYPATVAVSEANYQTIEFLKTTDARMIAEVGIYRGHTSHEIARWLAGRGEIHLYDFHDVVDRVAEELKEYGHENVVTFANSYKYLDSYNWSLARKLETQQEPVYDYVFLDGAHTFAIDALTTVLVDKLLKVGGFLDFDDYDWTLGRSAALRPENFELTGRMYTREQIDEKQVKMIVDLLVRRDSRYVEVVPDKIFQKVRD